MAKEKDTKRKKPKEDLKLVSFKVSSERYRQIEEYASTQVDDAGIQLSTSLGARRLMTEALIKHRNKKD